MINFPPSDPELSALADRKLTFLFDPGQVSAALDRYVSEMTGLSLDMVRKLIDFGSVWLNGKVCRQSSYILKEPDWIRINPPVYGIKRFYEIDPGRILYQDEWLLAYDKEANVPSQQVPYDAFNNLYAALKRHLGADEYLGLHHRLDRLTSGVMLFSLTRDINPGLSRLFREGGMTKLYWARVAGRTEKEAWSVDLPIAKKKGGYFCPPDGQGKPALTEFVALERGADETLVQAGPLTGRTHQIRLHLTASGHPILGDPEYQGSPAPRLMLHAKSLSFGHPKTGRVLRIEAPVPTSFITDCKLLAFA